VPNPGLPATDYVDRFRLCIHRFARMLRQDVMPGVSANQLAVLSQIERRPATIRTLATLEQVQGPTMTLVVDRMQEQGWVRRYNDETDRRVVWVEMTPAGRQLLTTRRRKSNAYLAARLADVGDEDLGVLTRAVEVLEQILERDREQA